MRIWNTATGNEIACLQGHKQCVWCVSFSPNGKYLASGSGRLRRSTAGEIILWDLKNFKKLRTLRNHHGVVYSVAFSHDGNLLAPAGAEGMVKVWETALIFGMNK